MVEASRANPALVPQSLWNRVSVQSIAPPYFAWSVDLSTRRNHRSALRDATLLNQTRTAPPGARAEVAEVQAAVTVIGVADDSPNEGASGLESIAGDLGLGAAAESTGAVPENRMSSLQSFARVNMLPPSALATLLKRR